MEEFSKANYVNFIYFFIRLPSRSDPASVLQAEYEYVKFFRSHPYFDEKFI